MHMRVRIFMARIFADARRWQDLSATCPCCHGREPGCLPAMDRRVVIVALPEVQPLDVAGPAEVFAGAATAVAGGGGSGYAVEVVAPGGGAVPTGSGYALLASGALEDVRAPLDTLVVAGGAGARHAPADVVARVAALAGGARRIASVCTGAYVLAAAGLLDGRRATTHWEYCDDLQRRHPAVAIERDPIFVVDGPVRTSAGVTAGMDLALALVEEDLGPRAALEVARRLVLFVKRPGGQAQFSAQLAAQSAAGEPLRELQAWMVDHLAEDLSVPGLAARSCMSERNFARAFKAETGMTPAVYVEALRVERARLALESGGEPIEAVARRCGFGTGETLRRAFPRRPRALPPAGSASRPARTATASPPDPPPIERSPSWRSRSRCTTASPPSTPSAPTRSCGGCPARASAGSARRRARTRPTVACSSSPRPRSTTSRRPTSWSSPAARARATRWATSASSSGSAPPTRRRPGRRRSAPARCCSAPRGSSTGCTRRRTGRTWTTSPATAPRRPPTGSSGRARSSRRPACRPGSTWRSPSPPRSPARTSRRRSSCASSTTRCRHSTPARPPRLRRTSASSRSRRARRRRSPRPRARRASARAAPAARRGRTRRTPASRAACARPARRRRRGRRPPRARPRSAAARRS